MITISPKYLRNYGVDPSTEGRSAGTMVRAAAFELFPAPVLNRFALGDVIAYKNLRCPASA